MWLANKHKTRFIQIIYQFLTNLHYAKLINLLMQNPKLNFNPQPITLYKIVSVIDQNKAFTINRDQKVVLGDFTGAENQRFHVYINNGKYAFVAQNFSALFVMNDNAKNGAVIIADPAQHRSSFFDIAPVTSGPWAGKAFYIRTINGKALNINGAAANNGADIYQWDLQGGNNQSWIVKQAIVQVNKPQNQILEKPKLSLQDLKQSTEQDKQPQVQFLQVRESLQKPNQILKQLQRSIQPIQKTNQSFLPNIKRQSTSKQISQVIENPESLHFKLESIKPKQLKQEINKQKPLQKLAPGEVPAQFIPQSGIEYKIVSALNPNKAFTVSKKLGKLIIGDYTGDASQKFKIIQNGKKFSFVVQSNNFNLCVLEDSKKYGATLIASPLKQQSSQFQIIRNVGEGQFKKKGYIIKTMLDYMAIDLSGSDLTNGSQLIQWDLHNGGNQTWLIVPASLENKKNLSEYETVKRFLMIK